MVIASNASAIQTMPWARACRRQLSQTMKHQARSGDGFGADDDSASGSLAGGDGDGLSTIAFLKTRSAGFCRSPDAKRAKPFTIIG